MLSGAGFAGFTELRPAISICFWNQVMFLRRAECHNAFRLWERQRGFGLTDDLEIHVLELPTSPAPCSDIGRHLSSGVCRGSIAFGSDPLED